MKELMLPSVPLDLRGLNHHPTRLLLRKQPRVKIKVKLKVKLKEKKAANRNLLNLLKKSDPLS